MRNVILIFFTVLIAAKALEHQCSMLKSLVIWNDYDYFNLTVDYEKGRYPIALNISIEVFQELKSLFIHMDLNIKTKQQTYKFINTTVDLCKLFDGHQFDFFTNVVFDAFRTSETFIKKCPVEIGKYYIFYDAGNANITKAAPQILPKGNFLAKVTYMTLINKKFKHISTQDYDFETDPRRNKKGCK